MTYEEAKEMLDTAIEVARDEMAVALLMAYKAVEKQIPKKPVFKKDRYGSNRFYCPTCDKAIFGRMLDWQPRHCDCGQALDWSDEK